MNLAKIISLSFNKICFFTPSISYKKTMQEILKLKVFQTH